MDEPQITKWIAFFDVGIVAGESDEVSAHPQEESDNGCSADAVNEKRKSWNITKQKSIRNFKSLIGIYIYVFFDKRDWFLSSWLAEKYAKNEWQVLRDSF